MADVRGQGGPSYAYRLEAAAADGDFTLRLRTPFVNVPAHGTEAVEVVAERHGYLGPIQLSIPNLPSDFVPSPLWKSRCHAGKVAVNSSHDDFPALLAEALDVVTAHQMEIKSAAEALSCTTSQLIKLLQAEPQAMLFVNRERHAQGLAKLW